MTAGPPGRESARGAGGRVRHFGGFMLAGLAALTVDAAVLMALTEGTGLNALIARLFSISIAMVVSWGINRRVTFAMTGPPTVREFAAFAAVSWGAQAVNYSVFAGVLVHRPATPPLVALLVASAIAMFVSYAGFRLGVFRRS